MISFAILISVLFSDRSLFCRPGYYKALQVQSVTEASVHVASQLQLQLAAARACWMQRRSGESSLAAGFSCRKRSRAQRLVELMYGVDSISLYFTAFQLMAFATLPLSQSCFQVFREISCGNFYSIEAGLQAGGFARQPSGTTQGDFPLQTSLQIRKRFFCLA